jgi:hypothetical protein
MRHERRIGTVGGAAVLGLLTTVAAALGLLLVETAFADLGGDARPIVLWSMVSAIGVVAGALAAALARRLAPASVLHWAVVVASAVPLLWFALLGLGGLWYAD